MLSHASLSLPALLTGILCVDAKKRLNLRQIASHSWVNRGNRFMSNGAESGLLQSFSIAFLRSSSSRVRGFVSCRPLLRPSGLVCLPLEWSFPIGRNDERHGFHIV
jgi:hypothetical protein